MGAGMTDVSVLSIEDGIFESLNCSTQEMQCYWSRCQATPYSTEFASGWGYDAVRQLICAFFRNMWKRVLYFFCHSLDFCKSCLLRILATNGAQLGGSDFDEALMVGVMCNEHHAPKHRDHRFPRLQDVLLGCVCVWNIWTDVKLLPNWYCH